MLSLRHKTGSCHKATSSSNPFTATKPDISLVFNQVHLVLMNALQLWKASERISGCFVGFSDETFHTWSFETATQQRLGKPKHKRKLRGGLCTRSHGVQGVSAVSRLKKGKDQV